MVVTRWDTAHGSRAVREFLQGVFTDSIIALHHAIEWSPRSLDLTPCDYLLKVHLKSEVYTLLLQKKQES